MRGLAEAVAQDIQARVGSGEHIGRKVRSGARAAAAHVVFDYDGSRELAGALEIGAKVSPFAMV